MYRKRKVPIHLHKIRGEKGSLVLEIFNLLKMMSPPQ